MRVVAAAPALHAAPYPMFGRSTSWSTRPRSALLQPCARSAGDEPLSTTQTSARARFAHASTAASQAGISAELSCVTAMMANRGLPGPP